MILFLGMWSGMPLGWKSWFVRKLTVDILKKLENGLQTHACGLCITTPHRTNS